jgi:hypothetical protein
VEKTTSKEVETGYIKYIATDFLIFIQEITIMPMVIKLQALLHP